MTHIRLCSTRTRACRTLPRLTAAKFRLVHLQDRYLYNLSAVSAPHARSRSRFRGHVICLHSAEGKFGSVATCRVVPWPKGERTGLLPRRPATGTNTRVPLQRWALAFSHLHLHFTHFSVQKWGGMSTVRHFSVPFSSSCSFSGQTIKTRCNNAWDSFRPIWCVRAGSVPADIPEQAGQGKGDPTPSQVMTHAHPVDLRYRRYFIVQVCVPIFVLLAISFTWHLVPCTPVNVVPEQAVFIKTHLVKPPGPTLPSSLLFCFCLPTPSSA